MTFSSKFFTLAEFTASDRAKQLKIDNTPAADVLENLQRLAAVMDICRAHLGSPIVISSGYRCKALNTAIGGAATSAHVFGLAADFTCPGYGSPYDVVKKLMTIGITFDQLIHEKKGGRNWVHLGLRSKDSAARMQVLTITDAGTRVGLHKS